MVFLRKLYIFTDVTDITFIGLNSVPCTILFFKGCRISGGSRISHTGASTLSFGWKPIIWEDFYPWRPLGSATENCWKKQHDQLPSFSCSFQRGSRCRSRICLRCVSIGGSRDWELGTPPTRSIFSFSCSFRQKSCQIIGFSGADAREARRPPRTKIFSISCSFSTNLTNLYAGAHLLEGWRLLLRGILNPPLFLVKTQGLALPPLQENPGSATGYRETEEEANAGYPRKKLCPFFGNEFLKDELSNICVHQT